MLNVKSVRKINIRETRNLKVEASGLSPRHYFCLCASGERDLQMANQRVPEEYASNGLEHRQDQGWRKHVSTEGERENAKDLSGFTGTVQSIGQRQKINVLVLQNLSLTDC